MKVARVGRTIPLASLGGLSTGGGTIGGGSLDGGGFPGPGTTPTATGSNTWAWGSNIAQVTVNGTTVLTGPFLNIANGSNTTVTADVVGAVASNTIRIHATGGGSVSFGSNATHVAEVSAGGASSDSARMDHYHAGIAQVTSSSSNTLQRGTLNLRPGTNVGFGLSDSDGDGEFDTLTITASATGGGGGGGGVSWETVIDKDGTTFTGFTAVTGTWASDGTTINQTDTGSAFRTARCDTKVPSGYPVIFEAEIRWPTTGQPASSFKYGAILLGNNAVILDKHNNLIRWQNWGVSDASTIAQAFSYDTWYKLRVVYNHTRSTAYLDGTLIGTRIQSPTASPTIDDLLLLGTYGAIVHFRNVKAYTLSGGDPA